MAQVRMAQVRMARVRMARVLAVALVVCALPPALGLESVRGGEPAPQSSDDVALNAIFAESMLTQNAPQIALASRDMPPEERYAYLGRWVLPGQGHHCRVDGAIARRPGFDVDAADPLVMTIADYPEAQWLLCPARELVQLARDLGRLDALQDRVLQQPPGAGDAALGQTTLLTLIAIAANETDRVAELLAERFRGGRDDRSPQAVQQWWSDLIVLWAAMENPKTADVVIEDYFGNFALRFFKADPQLDAIADYLLLLFRVRANAPLAANRHHVLGTAAFDVFSRVDACSHARARPLPRFYFDDQGAVKLSGHEIDYLAFRSPLQGNFEGVGEIATHAGAFSELLAAGVAAKPTSDQQQISIGSFARGNWQQAIAPPMQPTGTLSRIRAQSDDAGMTHFFNGRPTYAEPHHEATAPWVAVRSWRRAESVIAELSVLDSPTIPAHLDLIASSTLRGWSSYYDRESNDGLGGWSTGLDDSGQWTLTSERSTELRGCDDENLLYYVRPLTWNATVSYEFEYQQGTVAVHPCLGRWVFLIGADGVWLHRLTDGRYEPSQRRPDNAVRLAEQASDVAGEMALQEGWNRAKLQIESGRVRIWVNDQPIAAHNITSGESPTFGFFHYRDQTRASVRNVRLMGEWPRKLPAVEQQPLASHQVAAWDAAATNLADSWSHDFRQGAPPRFFSHQGDASQFVQQPDGLRLRRNGNAPGLALDFAGQIQGDFDIILEVKDVEIGDQKPTWHCGAGLAVTVDNADHDRLDIVRRRDRLNSQHHIVFARNRVNRFGGVNWIRDTTRIDESVSGRFRLIRQGDVIYGLYADGDSNSFRYLDQATIEPGPIAPAGLRLHTVAGKNMRCAVTLVRLEVRADAIDMPAEAKPQTLPSVPSPRASQPTGASQPTVPNPQPGRSLPQRLYESLRGLFP